MVQIKHAKTAGNPEVPLLDDTDWNADHTISGTKAQFNTALTDDDFVFASTFAEAVDDEVVSLLVSGSGISLAYDDVANTLTINAAAGGSDRQVQFNNAGAFAGAANLEIDTNGNPSFVVQTFNTANPSTQTDRLKIFSRNRAGRALLSVMGSSGLDTALQPHFGLNTIRMIKANMGVASLTNYGFPVAATLVGTATAANYASTNLFTRSPRMGILSAATAAAQCGARGTNSSAHRVALAGREGFFAVFRFGLIATVSDRQFYAGFAGGGTTFITGNPSAATNCVFLAMDSTDTNMQIMHNDGAGSCTKVDLGASFPAPTANTDFYELRLFQAPNSLDIGWYVENLHNGNKAQGTIITDRPVIDSIMNPQIALSNGATAAAVQVGINSIYVEVDY